MKNFILLITFIFSFSELKAQTGTASVRVTNTPNVSVSNSPTVFLATNQNVGRNTIGGTVSMANRSINSTASRCTVSGAAPSASRKKLCIIAMTTSSQCYIGTSSANTSTGLSIPTQSSGFTVEPLCFEFDSSDYYCVCNTVTDVRVLEVN